MSDSKFDLSKLKGNVSGLMGSLKSMINPAGGTPHVNPDDALGLKIAEITTNIKQLAEAQALQVSQLQKVNELIAAVFRDVEALRQQAKSGVSGASVSGKADPAAASGSVEKTAEPAEKTAKTDEEKK